MLAFVLLALLTRPCLHAVADEPSGWRTIENDDPGWRLEGAHELATDFEHRAPCGSVTELYAGARMSLTFRGTRVGVYVHGGADHCGDAGCWTGPRIYATGTCRTRRATATRSRCSRSIIGPTR